MGISLFSRNIANREQTRELIREIKETIGRNDLLIAVDQEGGRVRRLAEPEFRSYAAAITLGSLGASAPKAAALHAALISDDLKTLGINMNYAPSLDIIYPETTPALKSRCFSSSKLVVANLGKTMVDEYIKQGICPCIKHLPGHMAGPRLIRISACRVWTTRSTTWHKTSIRSDSLTMHRRE
ncbi:MAG: glycoside hydrolase family 3 N-terminal domain-containing protein [Alphaproteobacteria bacterium]